ncbi:ABC transporter ATP-binding protein [Pelagibacterium sediminicola]|uniref:ABC transporter ATP-binding protein n=1 Tax=Pelagibacterium sediminicola TaxID=2248761 RepID=UPI000E31A1D1|nr:ABC transporter ATP-binding protein [Pelagibacterium sediminicola]
MTRSNAATNTGHAYLELASLTKRYGQITVVDSLTLDVRKGEFLSLLGPSGCGKTTTLQMIGGFVEPTSGNIRLQDRDLVRTPPSKRGLGMVFQSYALFPHMTAAQNVAYGLEVRRVGRAECEERVARALDLVGLAKFGDRYPRRMSGGQQQRVALARALVIEPSILLLDEPLSNLDASLREEMQVELRRIQQVTGTTTILVTHDQNEAMALSDRIVVMRAGQVEQIGRPEQVYEHPQTDFVAQFLGKTNLVSASVRTVNGVKEIVIGDQSFACDTALPEGPVRIAIRPEKMRLASSGIPGIVKNRVFQGTLWLLEITSEHGTILVQQPNVGTPPPRIGSACHLDLDGRDIHTFGTGV